MINWLIDWLTNRSSFSKLRMRLFRLTRAQTEHLQQTRFHQPKKHYRCRSSCWSSAVVCGREPNHRTCCCICLMSCLKIYKETIASYTWFMTDLYSWQHLEVALQGNETVCVQPVSPNRGFVFSDRVLLSDQIRRVSYSDISSVLLYILARVSHQLQSPLLVLWLISGEKKLAQCVIASVSHSD